MIGYLPVAFYTLRGDNGYLGTIPTGTEVWIVAETKYYYFFVTDDGWLGWNGKSYFN